MAKTHRKAHKVMNESRIFQLKPKKLGLALGIFKGFCLGFLALLTMTFGWGSPIVRMLSSVFLGYEASYIGIIIGVLWGFTFGFFAGYLFAVIYNKLEKCC